MSYVRSFASIGNFIEIDIQRSGWYVSIRYVNR
jgi:hypothetical protein